MGQNLLRRSGIVLAAALGLAIPADSGIDATVRPLGPVRAGVVVVIVTAKTDGFAPSTWGLDERVRGRYRRIGSVPGGSVELFERLQGVVLPQTAVVFKPILTPMRAGLGRPFFLDLSPGQVRLKIGHSYRVVSGNISFPFKLSAGLPPALTPGEAFSDCPKPGENEIEEFVRNSTRFYTEDGWNAIAGPLCSRPGLWAVLNVLNGQKALYYYQPE
jgi:hypothetical protein